MPFLPPPKTKHALPRNRWQRWCSSGIITREVRILWQRRLVNFSAWILAITVMVTALGYLLPKPCPPSSNRSRSQRKSRFNVLTAAKSTVHALHIEGNIATANHRKMVHWAQRAIVVCAFLAALQ